MSRYSMAQIETLTGIKAHTIRKWEQRYQIVTPERTDGNVRFYTDDHLKYLLNIGILVNNGHRISKLDKMSIDEIHSEVDRILRAIPKSSVEIINGLVLSMLNMNEALFSNLFFGSVQKLGFLNTIMEIIYPFLKIVGGMWITDKTSPAQEHFISNLIRQKVISNIENLEAVPGTSNSLLLFLPEGESHEIGLLVAYYMAKKAGWRTYYLGQNVPTDNIVDVLNKRSFELILTIQTTPRKKKFQQQFIDVISSFNTDIIIAGNRMTTIDINLPENVTFINSPMEFQEQLELRAR